MRQLTEEIKESQEALEALVPSKEYLVWEVYGFDGNGQERRLPYMQTELSFFDKQDFITTMGEYIDRFAGGEFGIELTELFGDEVRAQIKIPTDASPEDVEKILKQNANLIQAVFKVVNTLPGLQVKIMLLALGVPPNERDFVGTMIGGPAFRRNPDGEFYKAALTDDEAVTILKHFIIQNAGAIRSFFAEKATELVETFQNEVLGAEETESQNGDTPGGTSSSTTPASSDLTPTTSEDGPPADLS